MRRKSLLFLLSLFIGLGAIISDKAVPAIASEIPSPEKTPAEKMGKDIFGMNIMLYDRVYHLPARLSDFTEGGWVLDEEDEGTMVTYELRSIYSSLSKGDKSMSVIINNITEEGDIDISECYVTGLTCKTIGPDKNSIDFLDFDLPGRINPDSKEADIIKAYGNPTEKKENKYSWIYIYEKKNPHRNIEFIFFKEFNTLYSTSLRYFVQRGFNYTEEPDTSEKAETTGSP